MMKAVKHLLWLNFVNLFGINEARHSKDKKKKNQLVALACVYIFLGCALIVYSGIIAYSLILFGSRDTIPVYLVTVISLIAFAFSVFRAGPWLFSNKSYEMQIVLPVPPAAIVISRFMTLYISDMLISIFSTLSVVVVCLITGGFDAWFYISMLLGSFLIPLLPMTLSMLIGAAIYAVTARMRQKNILQIVFCLLFFAAYFLFIQKMNNANEEMFVGIANAMGAIENIYLPASWFNSGVWGNIPMYLLFVGVSIGIFAIFAYAVGKIFQPICAALSTQSAKRNYVMKTQKSVSVFRTIFFREIKRYFAYPIYVTNTIISFIMAICLPLLLIFGQTNLAALNLSSDMIALLAPFVISMCLNTAPITICALSVEGKELWLIQSLPLQEKDLVHAKLSLNLIFAIPTALISSTIVTLIFTPSIPYIIWIYIVTIAYAIFGSVAALWLNMKMPFMTWDSVSQIVKQSKAVMFMMLLGSVSALVPLAVVFVLYFFQLHLIQYVIMLAVLLLLAVLTFLMYRQLLRMKLRNLIET